MATSRVKKLRKRVAETSVGKRAAAGSRRKWTKTAVAAGVDRADLERVKELTGATSNGDAVNRALAWFLGKERVTRALDGLAELGAYRDPGTRMSR